MLFEKFHDQRRCFGGVFMCAVVNEADERRTFSFRCWGILYAVFVPRGASGGAEIFAFDDGHHAFLPCVFYDLVVGAGDEQTGFWFK